MTVQNLKHQCGKYCGVLGIVQLPLLLEKSAQEPSLSAMQYQRVLEVLSLLRQSRHSESPLLCLAGHTGYLPSDGAELGADSPGLLGGLLLLHLQPSLHLLSLPHTEAKRLNKVLRHIRSVKSLILSWREQAWSSGGSGSTAYGNRSHDAPRHSGGLVQPQLS